MNNTYMGQDASQIGKAFASMGKDLEGAGMEVAGIFEAVEKQHNAGKMADLQLDLDQTYAGYQEKMAANPNNALQWRDEYSKLMESKQAELDKTDMSSNLRDQSNAYFKQFQGKTGIEVSRHMNNTILANSSKSQEVLIADLRRRGEDEQAQAIADAAHKNGNMPTARHLELSKDISYDGVMRNLSAQMETDPEKFLEDADAGNIKGISDQELERQKGKARRLVSVKKMDDVNDVQNLIDGNQIKDTAELSTIMRDRKMDATTSASMHRYFTTRSNETLQQFRNEPAQQEAIMARFNASLSSYKPNGEPQDMGYAERRNMLNHLNDSAMKTEALNKLDSLRQGKEVEIKGKKGVVLDQQQRRFKRELESHKNNKPKAENRTLGYHLNQGFLNNPNNLKAYFSDDDVERIMNATGTVDGDQEKTEAARLKMFKQLYKSSPKSHGRTKFQRDMALAITQGGKQSVISTYEDKAAGEEWQREEDLIYQRQGRQNSELQELIDSGDIDSMSQEQLNSMVSGVALQSDPSTSWGETIFQTLEYKPVSEDDAEFADAYSKYAKLNGLSPRPDDFKHYYDYRAAWEAGYLDEDGDGHLPSQFKKAGHPRTYMSPDGNRFSSRPTNGWTDTRDDSIVGEEKESAVVGGFDGDLINMVKQFEGFNEQAYGDYSQMSIGYGTKATQGETSITEQEAEQRLVSELKSHEDRVVKIAKKYGYKFTKNQISALTSFDYNTGSIAMLTANGTRSIDEISNMLLAYNKAGGEVLGGLVKRRQKEQDLFNK
jgi:GH24 family phage-related lysozyme (muramidase)